MMMNPAPSLDGTISLSPFDHPLGPNPLLCAPGPCVHHATHYLLGWPSRPLTGCTVQTTQETNTTSAVVKSLSLNAALKRRALVS